MTDPADIAVPDDDADREEAALSLPGPGESVVDVDADQQVSREPPAAPSHREGVLITQCPRRPLVGISGDDGRALWPLRAMMAGTSVV